MATESQTDGISFFDPTILQGISFVWEDGIHIVEDCKIVNNGRGISYCLKCGAIYTFAIPLAQQFKQPMEAMIKLPLPDCQECIGKT
jgi:hypothetical protein